MPVCFALREETLYTAVDAKPKSTLALRRLANIEATPFTSLLVDRYDEDWTHLWWVRVDAAARVVWSGPEAQRAMERLEDQVPAVPNRGHSRGR